MVKLVIKSEIARLERDLGSIGAEVMQKAVPPAINRTAKTVESTAVKAIAKITALKQKDIRKDIKTKLAGRNALESYVDAKAARAVTVARFITPARRRLGEPGKPQFFRRKKGRVGSRVFKYRGITHKAWGRQTTIKGGFLARGKSGNALPFIRQGQGRNAELKVLRGPSVRQEFKRPAMTKILTDKANQRFPIELKRSVDNVLRRRRKK